MEYFNVAWCNVDSSIKTLHNMKNMNTVSYNIVADFLTASPLAIKLYNIAPHNHTLSLISYKSLFDNKFSINNIDPELPTLLIHTVYGSGKTVESMLNLISKSCYDKSKIEAYCLYGNSATIANSDYKISYEFSIRDRWIVYPWEHVNYYQ